MKILPLTLQSLNLKPLLPLFLLPMVITGAAVRADTLANVTKPATSDIANGLLSIKIDGMQDLPISGLKMVKTGDQIVFISSNGRFALHGGKLLDIWTQQEIKDIPDIDRIANRIDLQRLKLNIDDLGPITVGHGKETVVVIIDPRCPYCGKVTKDLQALEDKCTFKLVMVPILGQESGQCPSALVETGLRRAAHRQPNTMQP
jgi:thiol:disulfide interchange protein DsbC